MFYGFWALLIQWLLLLLLLDAIRATLAALWAWWRDPPPSHQAGTQWR